MNSSRVKLGSSAAVRSIVRDMRFAGFHYASRATFTLVDGALRGPFR
jgi:hypothetical protein